MKIEKCDAVLVPVSRYQDLEMSGLPTQEMNEAVVEQMTRLQKDWAEILGVKKGDRIGRRRIHGHFPNTYLIAGIPPGGKAPYLKFEQGHPKQGEHRYDWFNGPDGIKYGFLRDPEPEKREPSKPIGSVELSEEDEQRLQTILNRRAGNSQARGTNEDRSREADRAGEPRQRGGFGNPGVDQ